MYLNKLLLTVHAILIVVSHAIAQKSWSHAPADRRGFIENVGQLSETNKQSIAFVSAVDQRQFYFYPGGFAYQLSEKIPLDKEVFKRLEYRKKFHQSQKGERRKHEPEELEKMERLMMGKTINTNYEMNWEGFNPQMRMEVEEIQQGYHTYPNTTNQARSWKKLWYRELYPGIDVCFEFVDGQQGIKYNYVLHPGADYNLIALRYDGEQQLKLNTDGSLSITASSCKWKESIPLTTDGENEYQVSYSLKNNVVKFKCEKRLGRHNQNRSITIDPWLVNTSATTDELYEVDTDAAYNVFTFGRTNENSLMKYDVNGNLLWTYHLNLIYADYFGDMAVHPSGYTYLVWWGSIWRIDDNGTMVWNKFWDDPGINSLVNNENWRCTFNCDYTKLIVAEDWGLNRIYTVRTDNNQISQHLTTFPDYEGEIRAFKRGRNGMIYGLTISSPPQIIALNGDLSPAFRYDSNQNFQYNNGYNGWGGKNDIAAGTKYIYTYDGVKLVQRDVNTGAEVNTINITAGQLELNAGIDVDECGNVYVGTQDGVIKYDQNLIQLDQYMTNKPVFDLVLGPNGNLFVSGESFLAMIDVQHCGDITCPCIAFTTSNANCVDGTGGTATVNPIGGTGPFTYLWDDGQQTQTATGLNIGSHLVTITNPQGCQVTSKVIVKDLESEIVLIDEPTFNPTGCVFNPDGQVIAEVTTGSEPYTYEWVQYPNETDDTLNGFMIGMVDLIVTDKFGCKDTSAYLFAPNGVSTFTYQSFENCGTAYLTFNLSSFDYLITLNGVPFFDYFYSFSSADTLNYQIVDTTGGCIANDTGTIILPQPGLDETYKITSAAMIKTCSPEEIRIIVQQESYSTPVLLYYELYDMSGNLLNSYVSDSGLVINGLTDTIYGLYVYDVDFCSSEYYILSASDPIYPSEVTYTVCPGDQVTLNYPGTESISWITAPETISVNGNEMLIQPVHSDTFYLILGSPCNDTIPYYVIVLERNPDFPDTMYLCGPPPHELYYPYPANSVSWISNSSFFLPNPYPNPPAGTYILLLNQYSECPMTDTIQVIDGGSGLLSGDSLICLGDTSLIQFTGGGTGQWLLENWQTQLASDQLQAYPTQDDTVFYLLTLGNCADTLHFAIDVISPPDVSIQSDTLSCINASADLLAISPGNTISWSQNGTNIPGNPINVTNEGSYTVRVTNPYGCIMDSIIEVIKVPDPVASFSADPMSGIQPLQVQFTNGSLNASGFQWIYNNGQTDTLTNGSTIYLDSGSYQVILIAYNQFGCVDSAIIQIHVWNEISCNVGMLYIPNIITMNGDQVNDVFYVRHNIQKPFEFECLILNRWGNEIIKLTHPDQVWDGKAANGEQCSDGVYFYKMRINCGESDEFVQGYVHLIH